MGKKNLKIYMKRNYPERYKKYFPKDKGKKPGKKIKRNPKPTSWNINKPIKWGIPKPTSWNINKPIKW